jgi:LPS export ABC transporter protein LptC
MKRFGFLVMLFSLACALFACVNEKDAEKAKAMNKRENLPIQTGKDIDVIYTDSAKLKVHLTAPQVDEYEGKNPYTVMVKGIKVQFFDDSMKINTQLTSNFAMRKQRERIMEAKNDVVVVNAKGERLNTEHLIWDEESRRIRTEAFIKITTADQVIFGEGLDSDESFTDYEIKNITGTIMLKDGEEQPTDEQPVKEQPKEK